MFAIMITTIKTLLTIWSGTLYIDVLLHSSPSGVYAADMHYNLPYSLKWLPTHSTVILSLTKELSGTVCFF